MVSVEIRRGNLLLIVAVALLLIGAGVAIAFTVDGSGDPTIMGHSSDEIEFVLPTYPAGTHTSPVDGEMWIEETP